jgi:hypothetical protein
MRLPEEWVGQLRLPEQLRAIRISREIGSDFVEYVPPKTPNNLLGVFLLLMYN